MESGGSMNLLKYRIRRFFTRVGLEYLDTAVLWFRFVFE
jgi:hypothetical protein